jgi:hypothetical protein
MNLSFRRSGLIDALSWHVGFFPNRLNVAIAAIGSLNAVTRKCLNLSSPTICAMKEANREKFSAVPSRSFRECIHARARSSLRPGNAAELKCLGAPPNGKGERRGAVTDRARPGVADRYRSALDWPVVKAAILSS